ncbi:hypothetical protein B0H19DRAFT_1286109 [Mycena capillaripes]|nr:hypothetical protein B0H19DRAFT_1286109 [Mycena capillaripes]
MDLGQASVSATEEQNGSLFVGRPPRIGVNIGNWKGAEVAHLKRPQGVVPVQRPEGGRLRGDVHHDAIERREGEKAHAGGDGGDEGRLGGPPHWRRVGAGKQGVSGRRRDQDAPLKGLCSDELEPEVLAVAVGGADDGEGESGCSKKRKSASGWHRSRKRTRTTSGNAVGPHRGRGRAAIRSLIRWPPQRDAAKREETSGQVEGGVATRQIHHTDLIARMGSGTEGKLCDGHPKSSTSILLGAGGFELARQERRHGLAGCERDIVARVRRQFHFEENN